MRGAFTNGATEDARYARLPPVRASCVVLDSPYCDFPTLASDLTRQRLISGFSPPWFVTQMVLGMLDKSVRAVAGFSVYELSPVSTAAIMHVPALFLHAEDDNLIGKHHVERLVRAYAGPRTLAVVEGSHSTPRNATTLKCAARGARRAPSRSALSAAPRARQRKRENACRGDPENPCSHTSHVSSSVELSS